MHKLAQGCYAIQSPSSGKYLKKYTKGGLIDDGLGFRFENVSAANASHFFMKPSSLGNYLLTDKEGRYLASHLPAEISAGRYAGKFANWRTTVINVGGEQRFKFWSNGLNLKLRHNYSTNNLYFFDLLNPTNANSEDNFRLVQLGDGECTAFPEITTNVTGNVDALKGDVNKPVRGIADIHVHITSNEFMGGKMMHGKPFHPWGVATALEDSKVIHGPSGSLDIIGNLMGETGDINNRYDTRGWPDFPWWPNRTLNTHTGLYYKWLERAHLGGVRLMVTDLVENEVLCKVQSTINPASWINPNSCNVMDSIRLQAQRLRELQDYVDAQAGGIGKGFFRLVKTPKEARQVIANGQMAVVMGVEASETLNCGKKDTCTKESIDKGLNELYSLGIRTLFPAHRFDNQFSGARMEDGLLNMGEFLSTGHFFEAKACSSDSSGRTMTSGFPLIGNVPVIKDILASAGLSPTYASGKVCNKHGLSSLGEYLVNRMIDKKMLIEVDHMSADGADAVLKIAEQRKYSGIVSSHTWLADYKHSDRIAKLGGAIAIYAGTSTGTSGSIKGNLSKFNGTPYMKSVGYSTDMGGLGPQARPRSDSASNPLNYPFTSEFGLVFNKQTSGNRTFDLNKDGLAHYGLMADYLQDLREKGDKESYESAMNFAEAFLQTWERAEGTVINSASYSYVVNEGAKKPVKGNWGEITQSPDALVNWNNSSTYAFEGGSYYRINNSTGVVDAGYPKPIAGNWGGYMNTNWSTGIDAAVDYGNGNAYFFKGSEYIRMNMSSEETTGPTAISSGWPGMGAAGFGADIDAAYNNGSGKIYFFKGDKYVRYDIAQDKVDAGYPADIKGNWGGLDSPAQSASKGLQGNTVIFTGVHDLSFGAGGLVLNKGEQVATGKMRLVMQGDGNLVLYDNHQKALWSSATYGSGGVKAVFQSDGNFVIYDSSNKAVWSSDTYGKGASKLVLQDDMNVVIYSSSGSALWNTGTSR